MSAITAAKIPIVTRITSKLIRILGCNPSPMTLQGTNTYLLGSGTNRILIDTGEPDKSEYIHHLRGTLLEEKATINHIILTHWHRDHIGGVRDILACLDNAKCCQVWKYPRSDAPDQYAELINVPVKHLVDGQQFSTNGVTVKVIHTPGHTTDHCVLMVEDTKELFSGDCILGEGTAVFEDLHDYMLSLKKIIGHDPAVIYPGHGNIVTDPISKIKFYIEHRNQREQQICDALDCNCDDWYTALDLVKKIYVDTPEHLWKAASRNVEQHLSKLCKENRVLNKRETSNDGEVVVAYKWKK